MSTSTISEDYPEMGKPVFDAEKINAQIYSIEKQLSESYNKAIADAMAIIQKYNTGKELSPLFNQLIPKIEALKK